MSTSFSTRNLFQHLPPPAECLALLIGTAELTIFGIGGLANPTSWSEGFGIPMLQPRTPAHPGAVQTSAGNAEEEKKAKEFEDTQTALVTAIAARNIQNGIVLIVFGAYLRDRRALGVTVFAGVVTTLTDYLVTKWYGVKEAAGGHLFGVSNCLLIGGSLLYWGRNDPWLKN